MSRGHHGIGVCVDCDRFRTIEGRGLCGSCYRRARRLGTLDQFPRRCIPAADIVENYEFLVETAGCTRAQAAERMGITKKRLEKAIERHRARVEAA